MAAELCETRTKTQLDNALRQLLDVKPLDQIRVRELTALCGIRRQSFYYHFPDVEALFDWSLDRERSSLPQRQGSCLTWQQALTDLLRHIAGHRSYYRALLDHRGREGLRQLTAPALDSLLDKTLDYYRRRCGAARDDGRSLRSCGEMLLLTLLESWVREDLSQPPESLLAPLETLVQQGAVGAAWQNLPPFRT